MAMATDTYLSRLLSPPNLCLVLGTGLLLSAGASVKLGVFERTMINETGFVGVFFIPTFASILLTSGVSLHFHKARIWSPRFAIITATLMVLLVLGFGSYLAIAMPTMGAENQNFEFKDWKASKSRFESTIRTSELQTYRNDFQIMLACRKGDDTVDYMKDVNIVKGSPVEIRPSLDIQNVAVAFPQNFVDELFSNSVINCFLALIPKQQDPGSIPTLEVLEARGGRVLASVGDRLCLGKELSTDHRS